MINEDILPYALSIGVDYKLFWKLNMRKLKAFDKAFKLQTERRLKEQETVAYMNGMYVKIGVACGMNDKNKFPQNPIRFFDFDSDSESKDIEINEKKASMEMEAFSSALKRQGLSTGYVQ